MAIWEENKHPRDKSGQFTSKGNEGQGGNKKSTKYEKQIDELKEQGYLPKDFVSKGNEAIASDAGIVKKNYDIVKEQNLSLEEAKERLDRIISNRGEGSPEAEGVKKYINELNETNNKFDDDFDNDFEEEFNVSDEDIMTELSDGDYYYGDLDEQGIYNLMAKRLGITPKRAEEGLKNQGFNFEDYQKYINGEDNNDEDEFKDNLDKGFVSDAELKFKAQEDTKYADDLIKKLGLENNSEVKKIKKDFVDKKINVDTLHERLNGVKNEKAEEEPQPQPATKEDIATYQSKVEDAIKKYGRIGGNLYDELDDHHLYYDFQDKKVKSQI